MISAFFLCVIAESKFLNCNLDMVDKLCFSRTIFGRSSSEFTCYRKDRKQFIFQNAVASCISFQEMEKNLVLIAQNEDLRNYNPLNKNKNL